MWECYAHDGAYDFSELALFEVVLTFMYVPFSNGCVNVPFFGVQLFADDHYVGVKLLFVFG